MKHLSLRKRLAAGLTAAGLLTSLMPLSAVPAAAEETMTYALVPDRTSISAAEAAAGDTTIHVKMQIENIIETTSILVTFALPDGFTMTKGGFSNPYCFGNGNPSLAGMGTAFNVSQTKALWYSSGVVNNEIIYDAALPFLEFDVTIPKGTPAGSYEIGFRDEDVPVGTKPDGTILTTPTCNTIVADGVKLQKYEPVYAGCRIAIGAGTGDVDGNGAINSFDAVLSLKEYAARLLGDHVLDDAQQLLADVDGNNEVNAMDATYILRYHAYSILGDLPTWEDIING